MKSCSLLISSCAALLLSLALCLPAAADNRQQLEAIKAQIAALQAELDEAKDERSRLLAQLARAEKQISSLNRNIAENRQAQKTLRRELSLLNQQSAELAAKSRQQETRIRQELLTAYATGRQATLKLWLNQESPEKLSRLMRYYQYIHKARQELVDDYASSLQQIASVTEKQNQARASLKRREKQLQSQYDDLQKQQSLRRSTIASLNQQIQSQDEQLAELVANRKRLEKLLNQVIDVFRDIPVAQDTPFRKLKGKLSWPAPGRIVTAFGAPRAGGRIHSNGVTLRVPAGSPVRAVHHGRVVFADWLRGYGLLIIVDHGDGYLSLYGQNQTLFKEPGDWVNPGEQIATAGSIDNRHGQLYFEIRANSKPQNPAKWCRR